MTFKKSFHELPRRVIAKYQVICTICKALGPKGDSKEEAIFLAKRQGALFPVTHGETSCRCPACVKKEVAVEGA